MNKRLELFRDQEDKRRRRERDAREEGTPIRSEARKDWIYQKVLAEEFRLSIIPTPDDFVPPRAYGPKVYRHSSTTNEWAWRSDSDSDGPDMDKYYSDLVLEKRREEAGGSAGRGVDTSVHAVDTSGQASTSTGDGTSHHTTVHRPIVISSDSDSDEVPQAAAARAPARQIRSVMPKGRRNLQLPKKK